MTRAPASPLLAVRRLLGVIAAVVALGACSGIRDQPAGVAPSVTALVSEAPAQLAEVDVTSGTLSARVPSTQVTAIAPLLSDRTLSSPEALASYGLDRPAAVLQYRLVSGSTILIDLGNPDFDHHFVYAQKVGDPRIFLLPSSELRPVEGLVGITIPPAT